MHDLSAVSHLLLSSTDNLKKGSTTKLIKLATFGEYIENILRGFLSARALNNLEDIYEKWLLYIAKMILSSYKYDCSRTKNLIILPNNYEIDIVKIFGFKN